MPTTPGSFIPRFAFWNPSTWAIPELYWDTFSQEQRVHAICKQLGKVIAYVDMLGVNTDDIAARLKAIEEGQLDELIEAEIEAWFKENQPEIIQAIETLQDDVTSINADIVTINGEITELETSLETNVTNINNAIDGLSSDIQDEATARENADAALQEELDNLNTFDYTDYTEMNYHNQQLIPNYDDVTASGVNNGVYVKNDNTLKNILYTNGLTSISSGVMDLANAITVANTYLVNYDKLQYGQSYTGIYKIGTYASPYQCNPKAYADPLMHIDCNTFTQMIGHGITYPNSVYNRAQTTNPDEFYGETDNIAYHPMFPDTAEYVKPYWFYRVDPESTSGQLPTGQGRMITQSFAKFLYDSGHGTLVTNPGQIAPGHIMFNGNVDGNFLGIGHCYMVAGYIGQTANFITAEAVSGQYGGVITRKLPSSYMGNTKYSFLPHWTSWTQLMNFSVYHNYHMEYTEQNINTTPLSLPHSNNFLYGARVVAVTTNSTTSFPLTIKLTHTVSNEVIESTVTVIGGSYLFYYPALWNCELSTTATGRTVNVAYNICITDNQIRIPARS